MPERKIIVDHLTITYKGLFHAQELYKLVDFWLMEKGYTKHELQNFEEVSSDKKSFYVQKEPYFKISDYARYVIRCEISGKDVHEVDVDKGGYVVRMQQGEVMVALTGYLETDYEKRWQSQGFYYFLRGVFDKYVWRNHTYKYESGITEQCNQLASQVRAFFNLYRYHDTI